MQLQSGETEGSGYLLVPSDLLRQSKELQKSLANIRQLRETERPEEVVAAADTVLVEKYNDTCSIYGIKTTD